MIYFIEINTCKFLHSLLFERCFHFMRDIIETHLLSLCSTIALCCTICSKYISLENSYILFKNNACKSHIQIEINNFCIFPCLSISFFCSRENEIPENLFSMRQRPDSWFNKILAIIFHMHSFNK